MKKFDINVGVTELSYDELTPEELELVNAAREATHRAYAPYSHFYVGAAIRLDNGVIVPGSNQENAAFPSGTCAERSACYYAGARYPEARFKAIAVTARGADGNELDEPASPCGACRQALVEYEHLAGHDVPVYMAARNKIYKLDSVSALLPFTFTEF
ncbi:MAG: cytidine deaminase [Muribaculaceae bacterium]|nr:cytidine deaminase [Muribaculaceae bacterium]MDE6487252.1 cytidine deaminase [Muribaculaceae bacterium]